ncbi:MAG: DoxX family protein [Aggregatilineales bacterium]
MNVALWIVQVLLAIAFAAAGGMKLATPKAKVADNPRMAWVNDFTQTQLRIIGGLEVAAAIGLILPAALDILVFLTPLAAVGLVLTMIGAALTHIRRKEPIIPNVVLGGLALFVAVGRFVIEPFA